MQSDRMYKLDWITLSGDSPVTLSGYSWIVAEEWVEVPGEDGDVVAVQCKV